MSELIDQLITVPYKDKFIEFKTRTKPGFDDTVSDKIIIREMFVENVYRVKEKDFDDTGVVVDIGANIGAFSILAVLLGAKKVFAFEPEEDNYRILCDNIKINGMEDIIEPIQLGVFKDKGRHDFIVGQGASHIKRVKNVSKLYAEKVAKINPVTIDTITFEEMFDLIKTPYVDVMKCDCEGSEYDIFTNATKDLLDKVKYLAMEFHTTDKQTFGEMVADLTQTFKVETLGSYKGGGQIYADRY